jgi:2-oxoglutarate ferredoxin oxidoreductase subunit gamma
MEQFELRFSGSGGQGLQLSAKILARALNMKKLIVAQSQSYEPTSRGGVSRSDLVVAGETPDYPLVTSLDFLVVLDQCAVSISENLLKKNSIVLVDGGLVPKPPKGAFKTLSLPFTEHAVALGNRRVANIIALGALVGIGDIVSFDILNQAVKTGVPARFLDLNLEAFNMGFQMTSPNAETQTVKAD